RGGAACLSHWDGPRGHGRKGPCAYPKAENADLWSAYAILFHPRRLFCIDTGPRGGTVGVFVSSCRQGHDQDHWRLSCDQVLQGAEQAGEVHYTLDVDGSHVRD